MLASELDKSSIRLGHYSLRAIPLFLNLELLITQSLKNCKGFLEKNSNPVLYRYFSTREARDNFLLKEVWFSGVNQSRFPNGGYREDDESPSPIDEFYYEEESNGCTSFTITELFNLTLSLSKKPPEKRKGDKYLRDMNFAVVIKNPTEFVRLLLIALGNSSLIHRLSLFDPICLIDNINKSDNKKASERIASLSDYEEFRDSRDYPFLSHSACSFHIDSLSIHDMEYYCSERLISQNIPMTDINYQWEAIKRSYGLDETYKEQDEVRVCLKTFDLWDCKGKKNIGSVCQPGYFDRHFPTYPLIQYLKIACQSMQTCCYPIDL